MRRERPIPAVSVVGRKKSGKTMMVVALIAEFSSRGYKVVSIKHDAHSFEIDHEGKDSYRHYHAGAAATLIVSSERLAMVKRLASPESLPEVIARYPDADTDLIITEGFKRSSLPKIEIHLAGSGAASLLCDRPEDNLIAVVSDEPVDSDRPVFRTTDVALVADFLRGHFGL